MGKSTTATMFSDLGVPVWNADDAVHRLYSVGGAAVAPMGAAFPQAIRDGAVDRDALKNIISSDADALPRIEAIVHPLVAEDRADFIAAQDAQIVLLDIPLLFETGSHTQMDAVVVVSAHADVQRARVLARPGMTEAHFDTIMAKQTPNAEKRARADYVIKTTTLEAARAQVHSCLDDIKRKIADA